MTQIKPTCRRKTIGTTGTLLILFLLTPSAVVAANVVGAHEETPSLHRQATPPPPPRSDIQPELQVGTRGDNLNWDLTGSTSGGGNGSQRNNSTSGQQTSNSNNDGQQSGSGGQNTNVGRDQNTTQNQATALTAEQVAYAQEQQRIQAEQKLWTRTLNDIAFDQPWGVIGRLSNDPNYTANRMLYDLNQDLPDLYALARAHWAQLDATPPAAEPVSNINPGGPPQIVLDTIWNWTHQTTVATPNPHVQAGKGIPGLLTYLETGMNLHLNETITSPAGPLHITGTATLTINWGDGETQTGITTPGAPYPDGQLTHHYPNSGDYDITVTANWTIHYNLAGTIGVIPLQTTGTLPAFPVRTLRAVARQITE